MIDGLILSYPKSGRTWVRVFTLFYGDLLGKPINFLFRHSYKANRKRVLLVREPCDILVSLYHQYKYRSSNMRKKGINLNSLKDFIRDERGARDLSKSWDFWLKAEAERIEIRYEDLFNNIWKEILGFFNIEIRKDLILKADEMCRFDNLKNNLDSFNWPDHLKIKLFTRENGLFISNPKNPETHKLRRGKVGGHVDYLDKEDIEYIHSNVPEAARWYSGYASR